MNKFYQKEVETGTEYILPDYLGDVKKVLCVSASAVPSGRFVSDGNIEFSGIVVYDVLYSDSDGELTKLSVTSDYDFSVSVDESGYVDSQSSPKVSNASVRFTGPRKLVAKASVSNSVVLTLESELSVMGDAFEGGFVPETDTKIIKEENLIFASSSEREYAEEAERLPEMSAEGIQIISTSGAVRILESVASENGVTVKGEIIITSIIRTDEQPPFAISKSIPFEETITLDGLKPDMQTAANGYLTSVTTGLSEDSEGVSVTVSAIAEFTCYAAENRDETVIADAYLKNRDTDVKYENHNYPELVALGNFEGEFSASAQRNEIGCEEVREILDISCDLKRVNKNIMPYGFELSGEALINAVACHVNEENQVQYIPIKFTAPFVINVNTSCQIPEDAIVECKPIVPLIKSSLDAESLSVKCTISATYHIHTMPCVRILCECCTVGEIEHETSPSTVTVYYPDNGERLFDIAKKFHTSREKIAADNKLDASVIAGDSCDSLSKLIIR